MIAVDSYDLAWHLDPSAPDVKTRTTVRFRGSPEHVDLTVPEILSASLNVRSDGLDELRVEAAFPFAERGFRRVTDPVDGQVYLYAANYPDVPPHARWHSDDPWLRAPVALTVTVPPSWTCLSNGPAVIDAGEIRTFTPTAPIASFAATAAAGPFVRVHESVYVPRSRASVDGAAVGDLIARSIAFYEGLLVPYPYPYPKCDAVFVHGLPSLALSVAGLILFDQAVLDRLDEPRYLMTVVSHEVAHVWAGNLLGTSSWLVEGLAVYLSRLFVEQALPGSRPWDDLPDHPLPDRPYAPHLARVLAVESRIGRPAVLHGLRTLMTNLAHHNATEADFATHWPT
ncbi:M1 family metallopeptidase [Saccharothrix deserti]|uniref:M1 family metallopeptidase n=1 Tax=Saccharothrix deserti TaxID=2593674 RepID=UPI00131D5D95|nr:M1 family aminopeptidase [Saccharothrix deserti]